MKMKDKLFRVKITLWRKAQLTRSTQIRAFDLAHAKEISGYLFGTLGVTVEGRKLLTTLDKHPFPCYIYLNE